MKTCPVCGKEYSDTTTLCPTDAVVLERTDDPLVGQTLAGKYLIEELIKTGGMGSVYRGKHVLMDKTVAIKVLRPSLAVDNAVVARFSREAKAASRISHPNAVIVTDFGEDEKGVVFLVMEYLDGRTLKDVIKSEGPMKLDRVTEIIRQVSGALDVAHSQGVIHRDLKSDNIMLLKTNGEEWAKVLDFGIAKIQQPEGFRDIEITAANLVVGTPQYMSPEQCSQSGPLNPPSDIYSLGIILYEMLTGRVPFTGDSPTMIMMQHVQEPAPSILETRPELPAALDGVVRKALAKQPAYRFQSAGALSEALAHAVSGDGEAAGSTAVVSALDTVPNPLVAPIVDDVNEETIVQPREPQSFVRQRPAPLPAGLDDQAIANFNPWRIMVPAAIVLVAVFGIVFLLTRSPGQTQSLADQPGQNGLVTDPNSQPVQQMSPPTGGAERDIQPSTSTTPMQTKEGATPSPDANANTRKASEVLPTEINGNFGSNENSNTRRVNKNTNEAAKPTPDGDEPPPLPSPRPRRVGTPPPEPLAFYSPNQLPGLALSGPAVSARPEFRS